MNFFNSIEVIPLVGCVAVALVGLLLAKFDERSQISKEE